MKTRLLSCIALMGLMLSGCLTVTSGNINNGKDSDATVKKQISLPVFNEISAAQGIKVIVNQGPYSGQVAVATTPSAEKYLKVTSDGGTLSVRYDNNKIKENIKGPSIITVTIPRLEEADLSSGAYMLVKGSFSSDEKMEFDLSSGATLNIESLTCSKLSIETSSGASASVAALHGSLEADASSGSSIDVDEAMGGDFELSVSSGADIEVNSVQSASIKASASSGGSIKLSGKTDRLSKKASSGGSVKTSKLTFPQ